MLDQSQLTELTKKYQTNSTVVLREYIQLLFLETLYSIKGSENFIFKGGTAVHLIYGAPRFSEDLDFTVICSESMADTLLQKLFLKLSTIGDFTFKKRDSISGLRYLMTMRLTLVTFTVFMNLDFSFRELTLSHEKNILHTDFPITTNSLVHHMSKDEIVSEKIWAILTRDKGRDIYDLWYLLRNGAVINPTWVKEKFAYYGDKNLSLADIPSRVTHFPVKKFIEDLKPFVNLSQRDQLAERFNIIQSEITLKLTV